MPLVDTLPIGPDTAQWTVWGTTARIVVTEPAALDGARGLVEAELARVDAACSRFGDSELARAAGDTDVSPLLATMVAAALRAAERTDGDVDPTVGAALSELGYDRSFDQIADAPVMPVPRPAPGWRQVRLDGRRLRVPAGVQLDLGATAKAVAADRCAALVAESLGVGVLVSLGGDIASCGPTPPGRWRVLVQDQPGDPSCVVALPPGGALASSSTVSRTWYRQGRRLHHIIEPATGLPVEPVWRTATALALRCVDANTLTTATLVRGHRAPSWLRALGTTARLVNRTGEVVRFGGWPA